MWCHLCTQRCVQVWWLFGVPCPAGSMWWEMEGVQPGFSPRLLTKRLAVDPHTSWDTFIPLTLRLGLPASSPVLTSDCSKPSSSSAHGCWFLFLEEMLSIFEHGYVYIFLYHCYVFGTIWNFKAKCYTTNLAGSALPWPPPMVIQAPDSLFTITKEPNLSCGLRREKVGEDSFAMLLNMIYMTLSVTEPFQDSWAAAVP